MALKSPGDLLTVVLCNQSGIQLGGGGEVCIFFCIYFHCFVSLNPIPHL